MGYEFVPRAIRGKANFKERGRTRNEVGKRGEDATKKRKLQSKEGERKGRGRKVDTLKADAKPLSVTQATREDAGWGKTPIGRKA
jgi:hypothetical protein